uniref:Uncharacterized protein n=1 Tax=Arundo donax TaxID=35708 RepID=A0A0A8YL13_ARUDO
MPVPKERVNHFYSSLRFKLCVC